MNRRFTTLTFGAIPVFALAALVNLDHIPGTNIALTVPYAAEGPGPMFNTLGKVNDVDVVQITGTDVDHTSGNLNMTTVSVRTNMTLVQAISRWLLTSDNLVPIDQVIPQNKTEEEVNQLNQQAFFVVRVFGDDRGIAVSQKTVRGGDCGGCCWFACRRFPLGGRPHRQYCWGKGR